MASQILDKWVKEISELMESQTDKSFFQHSGKMAMLAIEDRSWQIDITQSPYDRKQQSLRILKHEKGTEVFRVYAGENGYIGTTLWHKSALVDELTKQMLLITLS